MDIKEFKKVLEEALSRYGFKHINKAYYFDNDELIIVIAIQKSSYESSYYINFGFLIKQENPEISYPKDNACDVFGRFTLNSNGKQYQSVDIKDFTNENSSTAIIEFMDEKIKPVIDNGLAKYFELNPKAIYTATLKAKKYLNVN